MTAKAELLNDMSSLLGDDDAFTHLVGRLDDKLSISMMHEAEDIESSSQCVRRGFFAPTGAENDTEFIVEVNADREAFLFERVASTSI